MLNRLQGVFASLNDHEVRYLILGGIAAILHGVPRATFDLDILIDPTEDNARRLLAALLEAGLETAALIEFDQLLANEITVFSDFVRIDVLTKAPGLEFCEAWNRRQIMTYHNQPFNVVSKQDLIAAKRASARPVDLEDVRLLEMGE